MFCVFEITRRFTISFAVLVICNALSCLNLAAGEGSKGDWLSTYFEFLQALEPQKERVHSIYRLKNDGRPFIIYGSPNDRSFVRARLFQPIANIHLLGRCTGQWCLVRLASVTGWLDKSRLVVTVTEPDKTNAPGPAEAVALARPAGENHSQVARLPSPPNEPLDAKHSSSRVENSRIKQRTYGLKDLGSKLFLPVYEDKTQSSRVVGSIPYFAINIKVLGPCADDWCRVQRGSLQGWIKRLHLTDEVFILAPRLQIEPVMPIDALNIYSSPNKRAKIVARLAPPITNIAPQETCDQQWCKIRYSGIVGWVEPTYLTRQR